MHNAYFSSTIVSFRGKGSLSYFNDYSYLLDERFDRTPLSCCSCCCTCCSCCEFSAARSSRVPVNTSFLCGLRQSTLLQCSPYKRLTFGGYDRIFSRFPIHDRDRGSYEVSCSIRKRNGNRGFPRGRKERFRCMVSEEKSERSWLGRFDEAEAVISLLTEKVSEEYLGGRERDEWRRKRLEVLKNEDHGGEVSRGRKKKLEVEKRGNYGGESSSRRKKNIGSNMLECDSKCEIESTRIESREESCGRNERRETIAEGDNRRERTKSSSCSSYYSLPSVGEYGSDDESQDKEELFVKESLGGFRKDLSRSEEDRYKARIAKELIEVDQHDAIVEGSNVAGSHVEWDCRKKSEKKLAEVAAEDIKARKQSSHSQRKTDRISKTDSEKASTSRTQFNDVDENSALLVHLNKGTGKICSEMDVQDTKQSRSKWQEVTEKEYMRGSDVEATSESQKQFSCREESTYRGGSHQTVGLTAANSDLRNPQQPTRTSEILNTDAEEVSNLQRYSDPGMKVRKKDEKTLAQSSVQWTKGQQQQRSERISGQINLRREPDYFPETAETPDTNPTKISTVQSETRIKNLEENSRLLHCKEDHEDHQRIQSRKESQHVTRVSVIEASEMDRHSKSLRASEKRVNQEITLTSPLKEMGETNLEWKQPGERVVQSKFRQEAEKPTRVSSSHDESLEESSSVEASLNLVSQAREQRTCAEEEEEEFSQAIMMPPAPQLLARSSQHAVTTSDFAIQEMSSESGSSGLHKHLGMRTPSLHGDSYIRVGQDEACDERLNLSTYEDALGSAHRLEESSTQFVREFVEKAKHEASTSQIQKEDIAGKQYKKSSGQYGSEGLKLKGGESGRSSDGSGAKRHSGELWDVSASFVQPQEEVQEGNQAAGNAIMKRRGRSLWNIMADIVRLRWASHAETPISAPRSDEKSPSKNSFSSETWFSGRESDKNGDENTKRERSTMRQDATSFHQLQQGVTSSGSQGEISDKMKSKSEEKKRETDMPSSSLTEHGSTSKRISPVTSDTTDKNPDQKTDWISSQSTSSSQEALSSSSQLPAGSSRSPAVEANSENSKPYLSECGALVELAKPFNSSFIEVSQSSGKDGDLKQRKLHRNKQVLKDRFDEWEEAYNLESEQRRIDEMFMREALLEAKKAADTWEVPVGAVLVHHGKIIARGCNLVEDLRDSTAHAEMICIREASNVLRTWRLADTTLYVTLEPCPMCAGAILQARVSNLVWGAPNKLLGADGSWVRLFPDGGEKRDCSEPSDMTAAPVHPFHTKMTIRRGVLAAECADIMQQFFQLRRRKKEKNVDPSPPPSCLPIANQQTKFLAKMQHIFHLMFCL